MHCPGPGVRVLGLASNSSIINPPTRAFRSLHSPHVAGSGPEVPHAACIITDCGAGQHRGSERTERVLGHRWVQKFQ